MNSAIRFALALGVAIATTTAVAQAPRPRLNLRSSAPVEAKFTPKFDAVAETRLLMEGLAHPNYRALEEHLRKKPADAETWSYVRGQALLIAEAGNLLLLRPPRNPGQETWFRRAMELRGAATELSRAAEARDLTESRVGLVNVAAACNRCHQSFRVAVRIGPMNTTRSAPTPPRPEN